MGKLDTIIDRMDVITNDIDRMVKGANAEGRDLTPAEALRLESYTAEATAIAKDAAQYKAATDVSGQMKDLGKELRAAKSKALMDRISGKDIGDRLSETYDPQTGQWSSSFAPADGGFLAFTGRSAKAAASRAGGQVLVEKGVKLLAPGTTTPFQVPLVSNSPIELEQIPTSILEVLKTVQRDTPTWQYLRQTEFDNNAAIVTPGAVKPESDVEIEKITGSLKVIAHLTKPLDKYLLEDNDTLVSFVTGQMVYGLGRKLEAEVIAGPGGTDHFTGILNTSGIQVQAAGVDKVTTLRLAATQLEVLGYSADVYLVNPLDWAEIETTRATSGSFDLGGPIDRAQRKVWGTQVITSTGVPAGTAVGLDLDALVVDRDTRGIDVEWDRSQGFKTNELLARVEGRFGLSILRPMGIIKITLPPAPTEE